MKPIGLTLINSSDIANMADVSNGAVSNWRRRDDSFPEPVAGTVGKPLFDYDAVVKWLKKTNKNYTDRRMQQLLWTMADGLRGILGQRESVDTIIVLLCLRKASERYGIQSAWGDLCKAESVELSLRKLSSFIQLVREHESREHDGLTMPHVLEVADGLVKNLDGVGVSKLAESINALPVDELLPLCDLLLRKTIREAGRAGGEFGFVDSKVSAFIADLALSGLDTDKTSVSIYDPVCGISALTMKIAEQKSGCSFFEKDIDPWAVFISEARFFLACNRELALCIKQGDSLAQDSFPNLEADVVVMEPPFGMQVPELQVSDPRWIYGVAGKTEFGFSYMQDALYHLRQDGRAYVCTAGAALSRSGRDADIRRKLLANGCVEAVIALPGNLLLNTMIPVYIWVLAKPNDKRNSVFVVDCSASLEGDGRSTLPDYLAKPVDRFAGDKVSCTTVELKELLSEENASLNPVRWMKPVGTSSDEIRRGLEDLLLEIRKTMADVSAPEFAMNALPEHVPDWFESKTVSIGELVERDEAQLFVGDVRVGRGESLPPDVVCPSDISGGLERPEPVVNTRGGNVTQPGDILFTTQNGVKAVVDDMGGHLVSSLVNVLRLKTDAWNPRFAALALSGEWNMAFSQGGVIVRIKPKQLEIPMVDADIQHQLIRIAQASDMLQQLGQQACQYANIYRNALRYGTVSILPNVDAGSDNNVEEQA